MPNLRDVLPLFPGEHFDTLSLPPSEISKDEKNECFCWPQDPWGAAHLYFQLLCCSDWINSIICPQVHWFYLLSPLSNAFLLWWLITYASPIISIWFFFYNFYFFYKIFLFFIHFKRIGNWLLKQFITSLKSLSDNSKPDVPRCCLTLWLHGL